MKVQAAFIITAVLSSVSVYAANQGQGSVTFTGAIINAPCSISPETVDQTISLGQISASELTDQGTSTPVPFQVKLQGCVLDDNGKSVTATFTGMPDKVDATLLGLSGTASGAGIVIADQSGTQLDLGTASGAQSLSEGQNLMQFSAYLRGNKAGAVITPGSFQSVTNFTLAYQ